MSKNSVETVRVRYWNAAVPRLQPIGNKSDWIDLRAAETVSLKKGEFRLIHLGVAMKLPEGYEAHLAPRSSTFKNWKILQTNSVGVVDSSYCGNEDWWKMPVYATEDTIIEEGSRIAQFRIMEKQPELRFIESELDAENRGGFGSTGIK